MRRQMKKVLLNPRRNPKVKDVRPVHPHSQLRRTHQQRHRLVVFTTWRDMTSLTKPMHGPSSSSKSKCFNPH
jgi:hypothetical protein